jgi:hypothetical protein
MKKLTLLAIGVCAITASVFAGGCRNNCCNSFSPCDYPNAYNGAVVYEPGYYGNDWHYHNSNSGYNGGYVANEPYYYDSGYMVREPTYYNSWNGSYSYGSPSATYFYAR